MRKAVIWFFFLLLFRLLIGNCSVYATEDYNVSIFFANGMNTPSRIDAFKQLEVLKAKIKNQLPSVVNAKFFLAYNFKEGWLSQLIEVVAQRQLDDWSYFCTWLSGAVPAPDWFRDAVLDQARAVNEGSYISDSDLQEHVDTYISEINKGKKVIIVAHSQGNFYANRAFTLVNSNDLAIVAVATPSTYVAGHGNWTTLTNDLVVWAIQRALPTTLPATTTNSNNNEDSPLHHNFVTSYLNGDMSGPRIIGDISSTARNLVQGRALETMVQRYYPSSYYLSVSFSSDITSVSVTGPNISSIRQTEGETLASLTGRPDIGDSYTLGINYANGLHQDRYYNVSGVNDHFAFLAAPVDGAAITTSIPTFTWSGVVGVSSYGIVISDVSGESENWVWQYSSIPSGMTSVVFNCDDRATPLQSGRSYKAYLHTYDTNGNQATTVTSFSVQ